LGAKTRATKIRDSWWNKSETGFQTWDVTGNGRCAFVLTSGTIFHGGLRNSGKKICCPAVPDLKGPLSCLNRRAMDRGRDGGRWRVRTRPERQDTQAIREKPMLINWAGAPAWMLTEM